MRKKERVALHCDQRCNIQMYVCILSLVATSVFGDSFG